jgi:hypothetical protein
MQPGQAGVTPKFSGIWMATTSPRAVATPAA